MDEDELRALIEQMEVKLRSSGLSDLVDPTLYLDRRDGLEDTESSRDDPWPLRTYLLGLLEAFDRHLAVHSDDARREAINRINEHQKGERLKEVVVLHARADGGTNEVLLAGLPNIRPLRERLAEVIAFVRSAEHKPNPGPEM